MHSSGRKSAPASSLTVGLLQFCRRLFDDCPLREPVWRVTARFRSGSPTVGRGIDEPFRYSHDGPEGDGWEGIVPGGKSYTRAQWDEFVHALEALPEKPTIDDRVGLIEWGFGVSLQGPGRKRMRVIFLPVGVIYFAVWVG